MAKAVFLTVARHAGYPPCNPLPHGNNGNGRPGLEVLYLLALSDYALSLKRLAVWEKHVLSAGMAAGARARLPGRRPAPVPALTPHAATAVARVLPLLQVTCLRFVFVCYSRCSHRVLCVRFIRTSWRDTWVTWGRSKLRRKSSRTWYVCHIPLSWQRTIFDFTAQPSLLPGSATAGGWAPSVATGRLYPRPAAPDRHGRRRR